MLSKDDDERALAAAKRQLTAPGKCTDREREVLARYVQAVVPELRQVRSALWPFAMATSMDIARPTKRLSLHNYHEAWMCFPDTLPLHSLPKEAP